MSLTRFFVFLHCPDLSSYIQPHTYGSDLMKRKPKNEYNAIHLFLGLLLGFLLGSTMIYWHFDRQTDRILDETFARLTNYFTTHTLSLDAGDSVLFIKNKTNTDTDSEPSIPFSSARYANEKSPIAQDKLLYTRIISLQNAPDASIGSERKLDSLLGNTSNPVQDQLIYIEFWESPFNSVGYRMGKNKIVLYGIKSFDLASMSIHEGKIYLKYLDEYYPLELTTTFKPLVPVTEFFLSHEAQPF